MMAKHLSFRDPVTNVLKAHGFVNRNASNDLVQDEADDFALQPGRWQWTGTTWVPFLPPPDPGIETRLLLKQAIDAVVADVAVRQSLRDFAQALKDTL